MATKSFTSQFSVTKKNAATVANVLNNSAREVKLSVSQKVIEVKQDKLKGFFWLEGKVPNPYN